METVGVCGRHYRNGSIHLPPTNPAPKSTSPLLPSHVRAVTPLLPLPPPPPSLLFAFSRYGAVIEALIEASGLLKVEKGLNHRVARAMVHDVCIGEGLKCGGKLKKTATRHAARLKAELVKLKVHGARFPQHDFALEDAIVSHCSLSANMCVMQCLAFWMFTLLSVGTVNSTQPRQEGESHRDGGAAASSFACGGASSALCPRQPPQD
jgi:hypothetical protein